MRVVDSREPQIIKEKLIETGWEVDTLVSGDYWFSTHDDDVVGLTRKSTSDLLASLNRSNPEGQPIKKNFGDHLEEMTEFYELRIIVIEGSWSMISTSEKIISDRGIEYTTWHQIWNYLETWQQRGFSLQLTTSEGHTIRRLNQLYAFYQKPYHRGGASPRFEDPRILAFPSRCRSVGKSLLDEGLSLAEIGLMAPSTLILKDGIGPKSAELIYNHFNLNRKRSEVKI